MKKKGVIINAEITISSRSLYGKGKYININMLASYAHAPKNHAGIATLSANACAKNYLKDLWHLDVCGGVHRTHRDITGRLSVSTARLFIYTPFTHHQAPVAFKRYFNNSYIQN